jgi:hypothetical protein
MWLHRRSAPASVWLSAAVGLLASAALFAMLDATVMRPANAESAFTRGIPSATLAAPSRGRALYRVVLRPREGSSAPSGARVAAHRWALRAAGSDARIAVGEDTACEAHDGGGRASLAIPLRASEWGEPVEREVPARMRAVLPEARVPGVRYLEWGIEDGRRADVVGCVGDANGGRSFIDCGDGAPSRVFLPPRPARARAIASAALDRVALFASLFALACVLAGTSALRAWRSARRAGSEAR